MLLEYKVVGSQQGYVSLANESAGDVVKSWSPDGSLNSIQRENLAATPGQCNPAFRQPLGNIVEKISLNLTVNKASAAAAAAFARTTKTALLGSKCHFRLTIDTEVQYYPNGVCSKCHPTYQGSTTEYQIELETDLVTAQAPS